MRHVFCLVSPISFFLHCVAVAASVVFAAAAAAAVTVKLAVQYPLCSGEKNTRIWNLGVNGGGERERTNAEKE